MTGQRGIVSTERRFRIDIRRKFFTQRVVRHWHRLLRKAVAAPTLKALSIRLDGALGSLSWWVAGN